MSGSFDDFSCENDLAYCWAAGSYSTGTTTHGLIDEYAGNQWTNTRADSPRGAASERIERDQLWAGLVLRCRDVAGEHWHLLPAP